MLNKSSLLVTDIDGTLLENEVIDHKSIEELKLFQKNGNKIAVATGRGLSSVKELFNNYSLYFDMIAILNGAILMNGQYEVIRKTEIPLSILEKISMKLYNYDADLYYATEKIEARYSPNKTIKDKIYSINIHMKNSSIEEIESLIKDIKKEYSEVINVFRNVDYIDIAPLGCSKGKAAKFFKSYLNINHQLYCIGDSWNDISMLELSDFSGTLSHADISLQKRTHVVVQQFYKYIKEINRREMNGYK